MNPRSILIVDDSKAMRMLVKRALAVAGYDHAELREASDGKEAFEMICADKPDLVLTDWNMPEWTGLRLLRELHDAQVHVRIGFVTSESTPQMHTIARQHGAAFVVNKPFTPESLQQALAGVL